MVGEPGDVPRCSGNLWPVVAGAALWLVDVGGEACAAASGCASTARPHPTEPHLANPRHSPPTRAGDDRARTGAARSPLRGTVGLRANPRYHRIRDADAPSCTQGDMCLLDIGPVRRNRRVVVRSPVVHAHRAGLARALVRHSFSLATLPRCSRATRG